MLNNGKLCINEDIGLVGLAPDVLKFFRAPPPNRGKGGPVCTTTQASLPQCQAAGAMKQQFRGLN